MAYIKISLAFIGILLCVYFITEIVNYKKTENKINIRYEGQMIAVPKEYRWVGYDSIQIIYYEPGDSDMLGNGWEGHFCYPNQCWPKVRILKYHDTLTTRSYLRAKR